MSVLMCPFCRQETVRFTHEPDKCVRCGRKPTERAVNEFMADLRESEGYSDVSYMSEETERGKSSSRKGRGSPSRMLRAVHAFRQGHRGGTR